MEPVNRPPRVLFMATSPLKGEPVLDYEREEALILDENQEIKVPTRQSFVGRGRILQRCIRALRDNRGKVGALIHGMGGLNKFMVSSGAIFGSRQVLRENDSGSGG